MKTTLLVRPINSASQEARTPAKTSSEVLLEAAENLSARGIYQRVQKEFSDRLNLSAAEMAQQTYRRVMEEAILPGWIDMDAAQAFAVDTLQQQFDDLEDPAASAMRLLDREWSRMTEQTLLDANPLTSTNALIEELAQQHATALGWMTPDASFQSLMAELERNAAQPLIDAIDQERATLQAHMNALLNGIDPDPLTRLQELTPSIYEWVSTFDSNTTLGRLIDEVRVPEKGSKPKRKRRKRSVAAVDRWDVIYKVASEMAEAKAQQHPKKMTHLEQLSLFITCCTLAIGLLQCLFGSDWVGRFRNLQESSVPLIEAPVPIVDRAPIAIPTALYAEPKNDSAVMSTLPPGTWVVILEKLGPWLLIEVEQGASSRLRGWIDTSAARPQPQPALPQFVDQYPAQTPRRNDLAISAANVPALIAEAGQGAIKRYVEFFTATIRNKNTRAAYWHACTTFLVTCTASELVLADIQPVHVAAYIERLSQERAAPTVKQHLAAIRRLFDFLVVGQVIPSNPASSVRGPKHVVTEGKTPILDAEETRQLFAQFNDSLADLRDRAILGTMTYSFSRVSALVKLRVRDYYRQGSKAWFLLAEKGGKQNRVPAHHLVAEYIETYIEAAGIGLQRETPLFRSFGRGRGSDHVTERGLGREEIFAIVRRRVAAAGLPPEIGCHSFRGTGITNYLQHGGTIETAARLAGHSSTRTTQLYDRRNSEVALAEIERIRF